MKVEVGKSKSKYSSCNSCFAMEERFAASAISDEIKLKPSDKFYEINVNGTVVTVCDDCLRELVKQAVEVL